MTSKAPGETSAASGWAWWAAGERPERTANAAGEPLSVGAGAYADALVSQGVLTAEFPATAADWIGTGYWQCWLLAGSWSGAW